METEVKKKMQLLLRKISNELGQYIVDLIVERTRGEGKGVKAVNVSPLAELQPSTIKQRRRLPLHSETTPDKSNLTRTGKLLDSIVYKSRVTLNGISYSITISDKELDRIAGWLEQGSKNMKPRPFLKLSKGEDTKVDDKLDELIKKYNK